MKRILKLLARMYPAEWRARYGAEYEALLEEGTPRRGDAVDVAWAAAKLQMTNWGSLQFVLACMLVGTFAAVAISFARPTVYRSQTLMTVETPDPHAVDRELSGQLHDALTEAALISIIQRENLYPAERARMPMSGVVALMRKNIYALKLRTSGGGPASAFVLGFDYSDPEVAQRVDAGLVSELMASTVRERIERPTDASRIPAFSVPFPADLPQTPFFPKRGLFGVYGLVVGLGCGLIGTAVAGWRRRVKVASD